MEYIAVTDCMHPIIIKPQQQTRVSQANIFGAWGTSHSSSTRQFTVLTPKPLPAGCALAVLQRLSSPHLLCDQPPSGTAVRQ